MTAAEEALYRSLVEGPLLVGDLPEGKRFEHEGLEFPTEAPPLNFEQKLGHLYESALAVLLEASRRYDLLERNLQLQKDAQTTVGELDFLVRDLRSGHLIHLELATKFYLAVETAEGLKLPGPDARDNYFRKIRRLREHQLGLAQRYREALPERWRGEAIESRQLIYGCLFDRIDAADEARPAAVSADCRRGRWVPVDACGDFFGPRVAELQVIPKAMWPVPLELLDGMTFTRWTPEHSRERCVMVRAGDDVVPYFIAPAGYPE